MAPEVYESYLRGWFAYNSTYTRAGLEKSTAHFQAAIEKDPTFSPAYVGLANSYDALPLVFIGAPPEQVRAEELAAIRKALELDPDLAEAHVLLGRTEQQHWGWAHAEAESRRAMELNPNEADAYGGLAFWMLCQGRTDEAVDWADRERQIDPVAVRRNQVVWIVFMSRRYEEFNHELQAVLASRPLDAAALWNLGFLEVIQKRPGEAISALEKALMVTQRSPGVVGVLVAAYAKAGQRGDAMRLQAELQKRKKAGYVPAAASVNAYLGLGEKEQAFVWLEQAYKEHSNMLQFVKVHPFFDLLRGDSRFADLERGVGLG